MPTWSPDDSEIAFATSRDNYESIWAMNVRSLGDRRVRSVKGARLDAPSWGPGGQLLYHVTANQQTRYEIEGKPVTGTENVFAFRAVVGVEYRIPLRVRRQDPPALGRRPADADR